MGFSVGCARVSIWPLSSIHAYKSGGRANGVMDGDDNRERVDVVELALPNPANYQQPAAHIQTCIRTYLYMLHLGRHPLSVKLLVQSASPWPPSRRSASFPSSESSWPGYAVTVSLSKDPTGYCLLQRRIAYMPLTHTRRLNQKSLSGALTVPAKCTR